MGLRPEADRFMFNRAWVKAEALIAFCALAMELAPQSLLALATSLLVLPPGWRGLCRHAWRSLLLTQSASPIHFIVTTTVILTGCPHAPEEAAP